MNDLVKARDVINQSNKDLILPLKALFNQKATPSLELPEIIESKPLRAGTNILLGVTVDALRKRNHNLNLRAQETHRLLQDMVEPLDQRFNAVIRVAQHKKSENLPAYDETRHQQVIEKFESYANDNGLDLEFSKELMQKSQIAARRCRPNI